ncbi:hypothetical protein CgunFtcFv8_012696 [Champsocephalus gunnari]|uniref:Uncharacterized protein n=1 Tax=Champsocephalus gunnari TaxID=52237 RepID=A0AAN8DQS9_CHAGU|nr:hypothetical protein CgunFtcFv8_012696 [Champsocephalus gunnari]
MFGRCDGTVSVPDKLFACEGIRYRGTALDRGDVMVLVMGLECDHWGQQPPPHPPLILSGCSGKAEDQHRETHQDARQGRATERG